jgi:NAD(P)-dependent dehydrogenase (short-subunit alcohol dehydrogenase family)
MSRFPSQRVLITGAASGLGRALALQYAAQKFRVAIVDIDPAGAAETLAQVERAGGSGFSETLDVRSEADFERVRERLERDWGGLDILINNAGVASMGDTLAAPLDEWQWMLDINLLGVVRGVRALGPMLKRQRAGHIVNIASFAGLAGAPGMASYGVAKAGVVALSEQLRAELYPHGVGVSVVCPSFFTTNLMSSVRGATDAGKALVARWMQASPVDAADIAALIARAVESREFLLIPHPKARWQFRLKRIWPERYFHKMVDKVSAATREVKR